MAEKSKWSDYLQRYSDFLFKKIKPMTPSMKFQNGTQIQDGRQNYFIA
jgi:hypothetical protein